MRGHVGIKQMRYWGDNRCCDTDGQRPDTLKRGVGLLWSALC